MQSGEYQTWDEQGLSKREFKPYSKGNFYGIYPTMLRRLALRCRFGELKYGDPRGWAYARPSSTYYDSATRHLVDYMCGDNSEDHLAAAIWNIMAMMFNEEEARDFLDIESRVDKYATYSYFKDREPGQESLPATGAVSG